MKETKPYLGPTPFSSTLLLLFCLLLHLPARSAIPLNATLFVPFDHVAGLRNETWIRYNPTDGNRSVIIGAGSGPGLPTYQLGITYGQREQMLNFETLPPHTHPVTGGLFLLPPTTPPPTGLTCLGDGVDNFFGPPITNIPIASSSAGGSQPFQLGQPTCSYPLFTCTTMSSCGIPVGALAWSALAAVPPGFQPSSETSSLGIEFTEEARCWGSEEIALSGQHLPAHIHSAMMPVTNSVGSQSFGNGGYGLASSPSPAYLPQCTNVTIGPTVTIGANGGSQPFSLRQPYLGLNLLQCANQSRCKDFVGLIVASVDPSPPPGWSACQGQLISIGQNTDLFAVLGTRFGGDGVNTFALPDLRGRTPIPSHNSSQYPTQLGDSAGMHQISLLNTEMPSHSHAFGATVCEQVATQQAPGRYMESTFTSLNQQSCGGTIPLSLSGGGQPLDILQPSLALTYLICTHLDSPSSSSPLSSRPTPTPTPSPTRPTLSQATAGSLSETAGPSLAAQSESDLTQLPTSQLTSQSSSQPPNTSSQMPLLSRYQLSAPATWSVVTFAVSLTVKLTALNTGPWIIGSDQVTISDASLVLDISQLNPNDLDGFSLQLIQSPNVAGQFTSVTVISDASTSQCPITATISASYTVVFTLASSCTDSAGGLWSLLINH